MFGGPGNVGKEHRREDWLDYFDVVITGCGKPAFFEVKKPLFEVDTATGALYNTDNGTPMIPIGVLRLHLQAQEQHGSALDCPQ